MSASWSSRKGSKAKSHVHRKVGPVGGNYIPMVQELGPLLGPGFHQIDVQHDDWCAGFKGQPCNCEPEIKVAHSETTQKGN